MLRAAQIETAKFHRIMLYGGEKTGKTRLACAYPAAWGKGVYVAVDRGAEALASVSVADRERLEVVKPDPTKSVLMETAEIASHRWEDEGFGVLVWDTGSQTAIDLMNDYAKAMRYGSAAVMGKQGTPGYHVHPAMGDIGDAQNSIRHLLGLLFQRRMHIVFVCWQDWVQPKDGGAIVGGPATVGSAQIHEIAGVFSAVIRLEPVKQKDGSMRIMAWNQPHGIWKAGTRTPSGTVPNMQLDENPASFWLEWEKYCV